MMIETKRRGRMFFLAFGCLALAASGAIAKQGIDEGRLKILAKTLDEYVEQEKLAGGVLYLSRNGKPVLHKAFGWQDREDEIPMGKRSLHRIASQTKALTSAAIMILQERGQLLINDELGKYFPEWRETMVAVESPDKAEGYKIVPAKRSITIRDLLTHTAGVNYGWGLAQREWEESSIIGWYFAGDEESMRSKVRRMASLPHAAHPGEAFVYGYNTDILGALVEEISGQTLGAFLDENIFSPLGMKDTYFFVPGDKAKQLSTVYALTEDGLQRAPSKDQVETEPNGSNTLFYYGQGHYLENSVSGNRSYSGGAGAVSTAKDYALFLEMLLNDGESNGRRILSRKSVELMIQNHLDPQIPYRSGSGFGLGFNIVTNLGQFGSMGTEGAYGWGGAYHSTYWVDPEEELVVSYVTQLIPAGNLDDHGKIRALIYQAIVD